ncbi:hypothetical protein [Nonomuraea sp. CA-141351]
MKGGSTVFVALTYSSRNGDLEFVVSLTPGTSHTNPLVKKAAEAVLCPKG